MRVGMPIRLYSATLGTNVGAPALLPHLALRIGLAARAMPEAGLQSLMSVLIDTLGLPLTEDKFNRLNVTALRVAADGRLATQPRAALRQALNYLQGRTPVSIIEDTPPQLAAYGEGDLPDSLRLAVASDFGERIDGNFATCSAFLIYQVSAREIRLIDRRAAPAGNRKSGRDTLRAALLDDCHLLYAKTLSNPASACLMVNGIHPVSFPDGGQAREKIAELQKILGSHPPPWLARAMGNSLALPPRLGLSGPVLIYSRESPTAISC